MVSGARVRAMDRPGDTQAVLPRHTWPILIGVLLAMLLASLDQTVVTTAMPRVIAQLNGFDRYTWVATAYLLTSTVTVPIYGKLSDIWGRKPIFLVGITVFVVGSALCGAAQTMTQLILFRGLQGLGAGALLPVAIAVVGDLFPPSERGKWQGVAGAVWGFAALVGPTVGGWLTDHLSWRWTFYVNLPIGIVALVVLALVMPSLRIAGIKARVDWLGALLLVVGVVPLLLAFTLAGGTYSWGSAPVLGLVVLAAALLSLFAIYESRQVEAIIEPRLFANRIFTVCVLATVLVNASIIGSVFFIPLFVQGVAGASATNSGALLTPLLLASMATSAVSGQLLSRWGRYRYLALAGPALMMIGVGLLLRLSVHTPASDALPAIVLLGAGFGSGLALYSVVVQNAFPQARLGQVTSVLTFFRSIGSLIGLAVMGSYLTADYTAKLHDSLAGGAVAHLRGAHPRYLSALHNPQILLQAHAQATLERAITRSSPEGAQLYAALLGAARSALASALHDIFVVGLLIAILAFLIVLFLPEVPLRGREAQPDVTEAEAAYEPAAP